mmetsp:Transcript_28170/g.47387  ORF Transcript_28170/g.47387 Transcript_28170/m.47387 type:complete len:200 (-) Transcript_28170:682-1281(-)
MFAIATRALYSASLLASCASPRSLSSDTSDGLPCGVLIKLLPLLLLLLRLLLLLLLFLSSLLSSNLACWSREGLVRESEVTLGTCPRSTSTFLVCLAAVPILVAAAPPLLVLLLVNALVVFSIDILTRRRFNRFLFIIGSASSTVIPTAEDSPTDESLDELALFAMLWCLLLPLLPPPTAMEFSISPKASQEALFRLTD